MDKLLHKYCFTYSCSSEKSCLSSFQHRRDKINYFNSRFKHLSFISQIQEIWRRSMNTSFFLSFWCWKIINRISKNIEYTTQYFWTYWHTNRCLRISCFISSSHSISRCHSDTSHHTIFQLLQYFNNNLFSSSIFVCQNNCIIDSWSLWERKFYNYSSYRNYLSNVLCHN